MISRLCVLWFTTACFGFLFSPIEGQVNFEAGPVLAYYRPVGSFSDVSSHLVGLPKTPADLSGLAVGGELRAWVTGRIGLQLQGAVASSTVGKVTAPGGVIGPTSARVLMGSVQGLLAVLPIDGRVSIWVSGGPGLVHHGGEAYDGLRSTTDLAGVFGVGGRVPISGSLSASAGVTGLIYSIGIQEDLAVESTSLQSGHQEDILLHFGISWRGHGGQ